MPKTVALIADLSIGDAGIAALLGYVVVFIGLALLMAVVILMGKVMTSRKKAAPAPVAMEAPDIPPAPGSAGQVKLYNVPDREAAMIMAIVADKMGKPLSELRFLSIKEVESDEV